MTKAADKIAQMAARHVAAWCAGDINGTTEIYATNGQISVNGAAPYVGIDAIADSVRQLMAAFTDLKVACNETRHAGNRAVFVWTLTGQHAETGNFVTLPGWHEWELNDDLQVVRVRGYYDVEEFQKQVSAD